MNRSINWSLILTDIIPIAIVSRFSNELPDFATLNFLDTPVVFKNGGRSIIEVTCFFQDGKEKKHMLNMVDISVINNIKKYKKIILCEVDNYGKIDYEYWLRVIS